MVLIRFNDAGKAVRDRSTQLDGCAFFVVTDEATLTGCDTLMDVDTMTEGTMATDGCDEDLAMDVATMTEGGDTMKDVATMTKRARTADAEDVATMTEGGDTMKDVATMTEDATTADAEDVAAAAAPPAAAATPPPAAGPPAAPGVPPAAAPGRRPPPLRHVRVSSPAPRAKSWSMTYDGAIECWVHNWGVEKLPWQRLPEMGHGRPPMPERMPPVPERRPHPRAAGLYIYPRWKDGKLVAC